MQVIGQGSPAQDGLTCDGMSEPQNFGMQGLMIQGDDRLSHPRVDMLAGFVGTAVGRIPQNGEVKVA